MRQTRDESNRDERVPRKTELAKRPRPRRTDGKDADATPRSRTTRSVNSGNKVRELERKLYRPE